MTGGIAMGIPLSRWLLITTGFGALFMVSAQRYSEAVEMAGKGGATRALLTQYTTGYLRFVWQLAAGGAGLGLGLFNHFKCIRDRPPPWCGRAGRRAGRPAPRSAGSSGRPAGRAGGGPRARRAGRGRRG